MKPSGNATTKAPTGTYRYPSGNFDADTDYVKITFHEYVAPYSTQGGSGAGASLGAYNKSVDIGAAKSTVILYMPEDMEGEYGGQWQDTNISNLATAGLNAFGKAAGGDVMGAVNTTLGTVGNSIKNALTQGTAAAKAISELLALGNFGSLTVNDVYSVTTGQILNPNTEVLYKGPKMRNFSLNFKMAPRNSTEADGIKNIIHAFKFATLPSYGGKGDKNLSFVTLPMIADVTFMKGNSAHPWVTQFKPSVITSFNVSYTPDGAWATLPNGSPVATTMKITFQELKMVYADELSASGATY